MARTALHHAYYIYKRTSISDIIHQATIELEIKMGDIANYIADIQLNRSVKELNNHQSSEHSISDILETAYSYRGYGAYRSIAPLQHRDELEAFAEYIESFDIETIVEIGTARGGTLYLWSRLFDSADRIISVDLPGGEFGGGYSKHRTRLFEEFTYETDMEFVRANSQEPSTVSQVEEMTNDSGGIDLLFIDADHRYKGVKTDFENYLHLCSPEGKVVLHDINGNPHDPDVAVDKFWDEIVDDYSTVEFRGDEDEDWGGIGVIDIAETPGM